MQKIKVTPEEESLGPMQTRQITPRRNTERVHPDRSRCRGKMSRDPSEKVKGQSATQLPLVLRRLPCGMAKRGMRLSAGTAGALVL